jgi:hypothetical protein
MADNPPPLDEHVPLTVDSIVPVPASAAPADGAMFYELETQRLQLEKQRLPMRHCAKTQSTGTNGREDFSQRRVSRVGQVPRLQLRTGRPTARHVRRQRTRLTASSAAAREARSYGGPSRFALLWKLDRFAQPLKHLINALAQFEALGVAFVSLATTYKESSGIFSATKGMRVGDFRSQPSNSCRMVIRLRPHERRSLQTPSRHSQGRPSAEHKTEHNNCRMRGPESDLEALNRTVSP